MIDQPFRRELAGGVRIVGEVVPGRRSVALGYWFDTGSRDETPGFEGAAHFLEHVVFKGTARRTAREIAESLERVGGSLDAFTTKETTCFYARVLDEDLALAADVLGDLVSTPRLESDQLDLERRVVLEELKSVEDAPEDLVGDLAHRHLWPDDIMGTSILGTPDSLARLDHDVMAAFHGGRYVRPTTVVTAAGAFDPDALTDAVETHLRLPERGPETARRPPTAAQPTLAVHPSDCSQLHLVLMAPAPADTAPERYAVQLLTEMFGGGMSSRLFQTIREDAGLAYSVQCYSEHFEDCGVFSVYLAVDPSRAEEALTRTSAEMTRFLKDGLMPGELEAAKAQVRGSLIMGQESLSNRMSRLARTEFSRRRYEPVETALAAFEGVNETDLLEAAAGLLDPRGLSLVALGPARPESLAFKDFRTVVEVEAS